MTAAARDDRQIVPSLAPVFLKGRRLHKAAAIDPHVSRAHLPQDSRGEAATGTTDNQTEPNFPALVWYVAKTLAESKGASGNNPKRVLAIRSATMSGVTIFSRTDSALLRVLAAAGNAEAEAEKMSYGHPFRVEVAAQVANVQKGTLDAALARGAVGADWFEASIADVFAALARTTRGEKRPREEPHATAPPRRCESEAATRGESEAATRGESEAATQEDASREALGEWQAWLVPCCHATAPKAKEVKAILRSRGAPPWIYGICKEVSQKSAAGTYRKILKIGRQAVAAV
jgi:hypothetical protein